MARYSCARISTNSPRSRTDEASAADAGSRSCALWRWIHTGVSVKPAITSARTTKGVASDRLRMGIGILLSQLSCACEVSVSQPDLASGEMLKRFDGFGAIAVEPGRARQAA